jgi:hypothetical protein
MPDYVTVSEAAREIGAWIGEDIPPKGKSGVTRGNPVSVHHSCPNGRRADYPDRGLDLHARAGAVIEETSDEISTGGGRMPQKASLIYL